MRKGNESITFIHNKILQRRAGRFGILIGLIESEEKEPDKTRLPFYRQVVSVFILRELMEDIVEQRQSIHVTL